MKEKLYIIGGGGAVIDEDRERSGLSFVGFLSVSGDKGSYSYLFRKQPLSVFQDDEHAIVSQSACISRTR